MASVEKPKSTAEKATHTIVDTIGFTAKEAQAWLIPGDIQRGVKVNKKVMELAIQIKNDGGVIPGIVTLGILDNKTYLIDGQQRREAFFISEKEYGYADVRKCFFKTRGEMGEEFVRLNSQLVKMTPDDVLRGLGASIPWLNQIRAACPFVGYGGVRRGASSATMISMSVVLRCWASSRKESPHGGGGSSLDHARELQDEEVQKLVSFLRLAFDAWGREEEYWRLWGSLNTIMTMWIYRRMVVDHPGTGPKRWVKLTQEQFKKCLMSLSADSHYIDWLVGRNSGDRDRAPCYGRIKSIFAKRMLEETGKKMLFPQPEWSH